jgi:hypothetical protein
MSASTGPEMGDPPFDLTPQDVVAFGDDLVAYHAHFTSLFLRSEQRVWTRFPHFDNWSSSGLAGRLDM